MVSNNSNINTPGYSMSQISLLVSNQLKVADKKIKTSTKEFDWNDLRRTPQLLRRKANFESYTVDEEFEELNDRLIYIEKQLKKLSKYSLSYCSGILKVLSHTRDIGTLIQQLFDPYYSLPNSIKERLEINGTLDSHPESLFLSTSRWTIFQEEYDIWSNYTSYLECIKVIEPSIKNEIEILGSIIEARVTDILGLISFIKKHVKNRNYALLDYDKAYNTYETLHLKQQTSELSVKQSQQLYNLERKKGEYESLYTTSNDLLKKELPFFFKLVDSILQPLQLRTYYVQLLVSYQININLLSIQDIFHINLEDIKLDVNSMKLIEDFSAKNKVASDLLNLLSVVNFRDNFFTKLTLKPESPFKPDRVPIKNFDPAYKYCQAIFSYKGQQEGDISFKAGEVLKIIDNSGGWWKGQIDNEIGVFPGNYVKML